MLRFALVSTRALTSPQFDAILALKTQHWPYALESQRRWFGENVRPADKHLLGWSGDALVGYLRLARAQGRQGETLFPLILIDTVCIDRAQQGMGQGAALVASANRAIDDLNSVGLLGCVTALVDFYKKSDWNLFAGPVVAEEPRLAKLLPQGHAVMAHDPRTRLTAAAVHVSVADEMHRG